jgi:hypothetical protein
MQAHPTTLRLVWPPPGLESCQGVLFRKAVHLGFGSLILALPILLSVTLPQAFNSAGAFGAAWWLPGLTSALGLMIMFPALTGLFTFFRTGQQASYHGIDLDTILQVGADHAGDTAALIQGTRVYRSLDPKRRETAVRARVWAMLLVLSAAIWLTVGWALALLLASRGFLSPTGVWILAMGPAALSLGGGVVARGWEGTALRPVFGSFFWNRWRNPGQREAARIWGEGVRRFRIERGENVVSGRVPSFAGTASVLLLAGFTTLSTVGFTLSSAVGPVLADVTVAPFSGTALKFAQASAFRYLRLPPDPEISPTRAGEALQVLASAGGTNRGQPVWKDPVRTLEAPFFSEGVESALKLRREKWPSELLPLAARGLPPEQEAFLREVAAHPGLQEFETLARAPGADILGASLQLPLPEGITSWEIPLPRSSALRDGAYALVARAVVQFLDGSPEEAEMTLRTLLSAGFLLADESPTLIHGLVGVVMARYAADALEDLYDLSGRDTDAERLRGVRDAAKTAAETVWRWSPSPEPWEALRRMPETVLDDAVLRGLRWEYYRVLSGLRPCINPHQMVFGPDARAQAFVAEARSGLARYPAEGAVFEVMNKGWFGSQEASGLPGAAGAIARAVLGRSTGACAAIIGSPLF